MSASKQPDLPGAVTQSAATAEEIYQAYPLKVGKPEALRAIRRALRKYPAVQLLAAVKMFAQVRGGDKSYMPYPATWFNQERFADDPETWQRSGGGASLIVKQRELDRCLEAMKSIRNSYGDHQAWDDGDKAKWSKLVERKKQLKKELGVEL
jgi:hypothetical protein